MIPLLPSMTASFICIVSKTTTSLCMRSLGTVGQVAADRRACWNWKNGLDVHEKAGAANGELGSSVTSCACWHPLP